MSASLTTALRRNIITPTCRWKVSPYVRNHQQLALELDRLLNRCGQGLNRSLIQQGSRAGYASSSSIPIPKTEGEVSELLAKASSVEVRKEIFDKLLGIEEVRSKLPPTPRGPSGVHLVPIGRAKLTTQRTGIDVHHSPFEALSKAYEQTLKVLQKIPPSTVYRQSVESITLSNLEIIQKFSSQSSKDPNQIEEFIRGAEKELDVEMIETAIEQAENELQLASKMIDFQAWQELEEKPPAGQWDYFPVPPSTSYPKNN